jgi:hypothetical protein
MVTINAQHLAHLVIKYFCQLVIQTSKVNPSVKQVTSVTITDLLFKNVLSCDIEELKKDEVKLSDDVSIIEAERKQVTELTTLFVR